MSISHRLIRHRELQNQLPATMSGGGNVEGYLLKIEGEEARLVYCIMDEGILQYYTQKGGALIGAVPLTGCKVEVFLLPNEHGHVRNQFRVDSTMRPLRKRGSGAMTQAQIVASHQQRTKVIVTFAASSPEVMDKWAISILNWNRYSWDDPQTLCSTKDECAALVDLMQRCSPNMALKTPSATTQIPVGVSRAIQPL